MSIAPSCNLLGMHPSHETDSVKQVPLPTICFEHGRSISSPDIGLGSSSPPAPTTPVQSQRPSLNQLAELSPTHLKRLGILMGGGAEENAQQRCPGRALLPAKRLQALCARLLRLIFGICPPDLVSGLPGSRLIDPASPFAGAVEVTGAVMLIYSLAVIPLQLSFWDNPDPCARSATLEVDMLADAFFVFDIACTFLTGAMIDGRYTDRPGAVAAAYLAAPSGFWFDAVTSIPFSWIDWLVLRACPQSAASEGSSGAATIYAARALKPLKLLKMARILRAFAQVRALLRRAGVTPSQERIALLMLALLVFLHVFGCAFWKVVRPPSRLRGNSTSLQSQSFLRFFKSVPESMKKGSNIFQHRAAGQGGLPLRGRRLGVSRGPQRGPWKHL